MLVSSRGDEHHGPADRCDVFMQVPVVVVPPNAHVHDLRTVGHGILESLGAVVARHKGIVFAESQCHDARVPCHADCVVVPRNLSVVRFCRDDTGHVRAVPGVVDCCPDVVGHRVVQHLVRASPRAPRSPVIWDAVPHDVIQVIVRIVDSHVDDRHDYFARASHLGPCLGSVDVSIAWLIEPPLQPVGERSIAGNDPGRVRLQEADLPDLRAAGSVFGCRCPGILVGRENHPVRTRHRQIVQHDRVQTLMEGDPLRQ